MTHPLLEALDEQQRAAAESLLGPVAVIAGAGTGKTRTITHRIAYGIATGAYAPERVLALTFTARAAGELRSRLRDLGAGSVSARTFHAAALSQLCYFWPRVVGGSAPRILEGKARVLAHAAEKAGVRADTAMLRDLAGEVEWRKVSQLSIDEYAVRRADRAQPAGLALEQVVAVQRAYEDLKDERKVIDFEDVLLACAGMIEAEPNVAVHVREQYRFFVVDEYQDVSPLQQHLLDLWLGNRRDLCVVGDASQTIYSFAGARSDYLLNFSRRYPGATVVRLEQNYRSTPRVVDVANQLMRDRSAALHLRAATTEVGPEPEVREHEHPAAEAQAIALSITRLIAAGEKASSIAVLYRIGAYSAELERALDDAGVSFRIHGAQRYFDRPEVRQAVMALRAASVAVTGEPLFKSVSDVLREVGWAQEPPEAAGAVRERWENLNALMLLADQAPAGTSFRAFTDELLRRQEAVHEPTLEAVTLATLHSAKGLEWNNVFIVGVNDGLVPISYARNDHEIEEERRLLYVGITRARQRLSLNWTLSDQRRGRAAPSRFLAGLRMRSEGEPAPASFASRP